MSGQYHGKKDELFLNNIVKSVQSQKAVLLLWRVASESSLQAGSRDFDSVDTPSAYSR